MDNVNRFKTVKSVNIRVQNLVVNIWQRLVDEGRFFVLPI